MNISASQVIEILDLKPLSGEGGYFLQTFRSDLEVIPKDLGIQASGPKKRFLSTAIYYLVTPDSFSSLHRLPFDEVFHFYLGDPVEQLIYSDEFGCQSRILGSDILSGQSPQVFVPRNTWQGTKLMEAEGFALLGTTMSPGFDFSDLELPQPGFLESVRKENREILARFMRDSR